MLNFVDLKANLQIIKFLGIAVILYLFCKEPEWCYFFKKVEQTVLT